VHDKAVNRTLDWIENKAIQTRMADPVTGAMIRKGNQKMVAARFSRAGYRAELITDNAGELADHLERASGEGVSALDAAAQAATERAIVREFHDLAHDGAPDKAIERYWRGAEIEKKPDRQIAGWGGGIRNRGAAHARDGPRGGRRSGAGEGRQSVA